MRWQCQLLGKLTVRGWGREIERFRTQKTALLLGYLAYHLGEWQERIALADLLWGDEWGSDASLRTALSSLRKQLEPPGVPAGAVLQTMRYQVRLNPEAVQTDLQLFWAALEKADNASEPVDQLHAFFDALQLYRGELLQGLEADWLTLPRRKLKRAYLDALYRGTLLMMAHGYHQDALDLAYRAVHIYPACEEASKLLTTLLLAMGQREVAEAEHQRLQGELARLLGSYPRYTLASLERQAEAIRVAPIGMRRLAPVAQAASQKLSQVPTPLTRFWGREAELHHAETLLLKRQVRLLTVTGPPGVGKTRFGQELAQRLSRLYEQRIFWVALREASCVEEAVYAFAQRFEITEWRDRDMLARMVAARLSGSPALLITDQWEHVLDAAPLLTLILRYTPSLQAVALSRHPLEVEGEHLLPLEPLPLPNPNDEIMTLLTNPSVALFMDRAQAVRPDFAITEFNRATIAQLCHRLEGIPLALELAAAQLHNQSLTQMLEHIEARLEWLQSRRRDAGAYRSLQAALDTSYALLTQEQRHAFETLALLQGEWDEEAATALLGAPAAPYLHALVRHSLLKQIWQDDQCRYTMLDTVRLYAQRKLNGRRDLRTLQQRHFRHFAQLAHRAGQEFNTAAQRRWLARLRACYPNLSTAIEWGICHAPRRCATMLVDIGYFLDWESRWQEGQQWCMRLLASGALTRRQRAQLLSWLGLFELRQEQFEPAEAHLRESIALCQAIRDFNELAGAYDMLGLVYKETGRLDEANETFAKGAKAARRHAHPMVLAPILHNWGLLVLEQGDFDQAERLFLEARTLYEQAGAPLPLANTLGSLGNSYLEQGRYEEARACYLTAQQVYEETNHPQGIARILNNLGCVAAQQGQHEQASIYFERALELVLREGASLRLQWIVLLNRAEVALKLERLEAARTSLSLCQQLPSPKGSATLQSLWQELMSSLQDAERSASGCLKQG